MLSSVTRNTAVGCVTIIRFCLLCRQVRASRSPNQRPAPRIHTRYYNYHNYYYYYNSYHYYYYNYCYYYYYHYHYRLSYLPLSATIDYYRYRLLLPLPLPLLLPIVLRLLLNEPNETRVSYKSTRPRSQRYMILFFIILPFVLCYKTLASQTVLCLPHDVQNAYAVSLAFCRTPIMRPISSESPIPSIFWRRTRKRSIYQRQNVKLNRKYLLEYIRKLEMGCLVIPKYPVCRRISEIETAVYFAYLEASWSRSNGVTLTPK